MQSALDMNRTTILLTDDQKNFLENKAKEFGSSKGGIIRMLIMKFMEDSHGHD